MQVAGQSGGSDGALIARARAGDRNAFRELYERHFAGIHDFAFRIVRDRELAADVVQTTFAKAWAACLARKEVRNVKAWLYTIARNAAIDELRARRPLEPVEDMSVFAQVDTSRLTDPEAALADRELAELVWASAAALRPQDYSLLHMHVVQGLGADELAAELGLSKGAVYTRVSRLKGSLEEAVAVTVLVRDGRRDCPELDALLASLGATDAAAPEVRVAVSRHVEECERCRERRRKLVSPVAILGALAPVPAAPGLAEEVWARIAEAGSAPARPRSRTPAALGVVAALLVAAGASAVVLASRGDGVRLEDPADVRSTSHRPGVPSRDPVVVMAWTRPRDAGGYSISWTRGGPVLPDADADLAAALTGTRRALEPGRWWFNLRTEGGGRWTSTVHAGPYVVAAAPARVAVERPPAPPPKPVAKPKKRPKPHTRTAPAETTARTETEPAPVETQPAGTRPAETQPSPATTVAQPAETTVASPPPTAPAPAKPKPAARPSAPKPAVSKPAVPKPAVPKPAEPPAAPPAKATLTVQLAGLGEGSVAAAGGIACGSACSAAYDAGTAVTLTAAAADGSTFAGWGGACSGTGVCTVTLREAASVTATFDRRRHTLTVALAGAGAGRVTGNPGGIDCPAACAAAFDHGTTVTLLAAAAPQSQFAGWGGACSGTGQCTVTLTDAASVTAEFVPVGH